MPAQPQGKHRGFAPTQKRGKDFRQADLGAINHNGSPHLYPGNIPSSRAWWFDLRTFERSCRGAFFQRRPLSAASEMAAAPQPACSTWPAVSVLKPIYGLEKNLRANLRSACMQDYPTYQLVLSVQRPHDPALPLLWEMQQEFGSERVCVVIADSEPVINGKIQNLMHAFSAARNDIFVISDSDVVLRPDYLKAIVAPLRDPQVGYVCTLYRATQAEHMWERLELLSMNADFTVHLIFAAVTGVSDFCLGASTALRRSTLECIGGFEALGQYLVEDYEMGRRIRAAGLTSVLVPYAIDLVVDLPRVADWWRHQVYWDQNTRAARPIGFLTTVLTRAVPFALLFAAVRVFDTTGVFVLALTLALRVGTSSLILSRYGMNDRIGLRNLILLPVRDVLGLVSWLLALSKNTFVWRGLEFGLARDGRIIPRKAST